MLTVPVHNRPIEAPHFSLASCLCERISLNPAIHCKETLHVPNHYDPTDRYTACGKWSNVMSSKRKIEPASDVKKTFIYAGTALLLASSPAHAAVLDLFTPEERMVTSKWQIVNDGVMGGKSQSSISDGSSGTLIFQGNVSLKNNGGFASTRSPAIRTNLGDYDGIELVVIGDGNTYKCGLRTGREFDGIAHQSNFQTQAGTEQTIRIPFSDFNPTWRGRRLDESKRMTPDQIGSIGFLISDKQEGPFQLEIKAIRAYSDHAPTMRNVLDQPPISQINE